MMPVADRRSLAGPYLTLSLPRQQTGRPELANLYADERSADTMVSRSSSITWQRRGYAPLAPLAAFAPSAGNA
jgi:hypothetical protein